MVFRSGQEKAKKQKSSASKSSVLTVVDDGKCDATVVGHYVPDGATRLAILSIAPGEEKTGRQERRNSGVF